MNQINQHIPEDDLALFALALMPPEEAAYTQAHLKHCTQCRNEVARMQGDLVTYAFSADMHDPPAEARTRLLDAVAHEKQLHIAEPAAEPMLASRNSNLLDRGKVREMPARRGPGVLGWAGWAIAAGALAVAGWQFQQGSNLREQIAQSREQIMEKGAVAQQNAAAAQQNAAVAEQNADLAKQTAEEAARAQRVLQTLTDPQAMQVALHLATSKTPPSPEGHASYNPNRGELVFVATHLAPVQSGKTYELWVLPASGAAPVAAGLFRPDINGNASVLLPKIPKHIEAKGFGVTVEAEGGSGSPTLPIVLAGT